VLGQSPDWRQDGVTCADVFQNTLTARCSSRPSCLASAALQPTAAAAAAGVAAAAAAVAGARGTCAAVWTSVRVPGAIRPG